MGYSHALSLKNLFSGLESRLHLFFNTSGSYYPDQHQYGSSDSLSTDQGGSRRHGSHRAAPRGMGHRTPDPPAQQTSKPSSLRRVESTPKQTHSEPAERVPVNGHVPQTQNAARDPAAGKRKLKVGLEKHSLAPFSSSYQSQVQCVQFSLSSECHVIVNKCIEVCTHI